MCVSNIILGITANELIFFSFMFGNLALDTSVLGFRVNVLADEKTKARSCSSGRCMYYSGIYRMHCRPRILRRVNDPTCTQKH